MKSSSCSKRKSCVSARFLATQSTTLFFQIVIVYVCFLPRLCCAYTWSGSQTGTQVIGCEGNVLTFSCPQEAIQINWCNYGRLSSSVCTSNPSGLSDTTCDLDCRSTVQALCQNEVSCTFTPSDGVFTTDPCSSTYKYVEIYYSCAAATTVTIGQLYTNGLTTPSANSYYSVPVNGLYAYINVFFILSNSTMGALTITYEANSSANVVVGPSVNWAPQYYLQQINTATAYVAGQTAYYFFSVSAAAYSAYLVFVLPPPPSITSVIPSTGNTQGGDTITITGSYFTSSGQAYLNGQTCNTVTWSTSSVTCTTPAGQGTGLGIFLVTNIPATGGSNSVSFSYIAPAITAVSPAVIPTVGGTLTITGSNFGQTPSVTIAVATCTITSSAYNQIICTVPAGEGINLAVQVTVGGQSSNSNYVVNYSPPVISSFSPSSANTTGGVNFTIIGSSFGTTGSVTIGTYSCAVLTYNNTFIVCQISAGQGNGLAVGVTAAGQIGYASATFGYNNPYITSISPNTGPTLGGTTLTVRGYNFGSSHTVTIGTSGCNVLSGNDTYLTCKLPSATGASLTVQVAVGTQTSNALTFSYYPPVISYFSPTQVATTGTASLTIFGSNFGSSGSSVTFGTSSCTVQTQNDSMITCVVPSGSGVNISVVVSVNSQSSSISYIKYIAPNITGISPAVGNTYGTTLVVISGTNFGPSGSVYLDTTVCPSTTYTSNVILCTPPAGQGLLHNITVVTGTQTSNQVTYNYYGPTISSISPTSQPTQGGLLVTITGTNFGTSGVILLGGQVCAWTALNYGQQQVVCSVPTGTGLNLPVNITVSSQVSNNVYFNYSAPSITNLAPTTFATIGGASLVLTGSSFDTAGTIYVGGLVCAQVSYGQTSITCNIPAGQGISVSVQVVTLRNLSSNIMTINYIAPSVTQVSPSSGYTIGGYLITLTGTNFGLFGTVAIGGNPCTQGASGTSWSHLQIICTAPPGYNTGLTVIVTVASQTNIPAYFSYSPPTISLISPTNGPSSGNIPLLISGTSFSASSATVAVNGRSCAVSSQNHTFINCTLPVGAGLSQAVQVTVGAQISNTVTFNFDAPSVVSITPSSGPTSGGIFVTVSGSSFGASVSTPSVTIGGSACALVSNITQLDNKLVCWLPIGSGVSQAIVITVASQTSNNNVIFNYFPPSISSISPANGPSAGALPLTVSGSSFGTQAQGFVTVNGKTCASTSWSQYQVICTLPEGQGANVPVLVVVSSQTSLAANFTYDRPVITHMTPTCGPTNGGGVIITLTGVSFGTSGVVAIGGNNCPVYNSYYNELGIQCQLPVGQGLSQQVVITSGGFTNTDYTVFNYLGPTITSVSPQNGPTAGSLQNSQITIVGSNFGTYGIVTIGSQICTPITNGYANGRIQCLVPPGQDTQYAVVVNVSSQASNANFLYSYDPPVLSSVYPLNGPTSGGYNISINGNNFGINQVASLSTSSCTILFGNHTLIICAAPSGVGTALNVIVKAGVVNGGQTLANPSLFQFSYNAPTITSVTGCPTTCGNGTCNCLPQGHTLVTIQGTNFGANAASIIVTIGGLNCYNYPTEPILSVAHTTILCSVPLNVGFSLPVMVTVAGQSASQNYVSYSGPTITAGTLGICGGSGSTSVTLSTTNAGTCITFSGTYFGSSPDSSTTVTYGPITNPSLFTCTLVSGQSTSTLIMCTLQITVGQNLVFQVHVQAGFNNLVQVSQAGTDVLNAPQPVIVAGTIRDSQGAIGGTSIVGVESAGEIVVFDVQYIGSTSSLLTVTYGPAGGSSLYTCNSPSILVASSGSTAGTVQCTTSQGSGGPYVFTVTVLNFASAQGTDTFKYPAVPLVYAISGCPIFSSLTNATSDCPTDSGSLTLTVIGDNFTPTLMTCKIGVYDCTPVTYLSAQEFTCPLPVGVGQNLPVTVITNSLFSFAYPLVSYALANITSVQGCAVNSASSTSDCVRTGGDTITINGNNFGASGASVLLDGVRCINVTHAAAPNNHKQVTCITPSGTLLSMSVLLIQDGGTLSSNYGTLSYLQCAAGYYAPLNTVTCQACAAGSYTGVLGSFSCVQCAAGTYATGTGNTICTLCNVGSYSVQTGALGAQNCTECGQGTYADTSGNAVCLSCDPGYYSSSSGSTSCIKCDAGTFAGGVGTTSCTNCSTGYFASSSGSLVCSVCPAGSYASTVGSTACTPCLAGSYRGVSDSPSECIPCPSGSSVSVSGQPQCQQCDAGSFANVSGLQTCFSCPAGSYSVKVGGVGALGCTACPAGEYIDVAGQGVCLQCPSGTYQPFQGASACINCPAGTEQPSSGFASCVNCTTGYYSSQAGAETCTICGTGTYTAVSGLTVCTACSAGSWQQYTGKSFCDLCPAGSAINSAGQAACKSCSSGYYSNSTGFTTCSVCPVGYFSSTTGLTTCTQCGMGYYTSAEGQDTCQQCPVGFYSSANASSTCTACDIGTFASNAASSQCSNCSAGYYAPSTGSLICQSCPVGSISPTQGASFCTPCPIGYIAASAGLSTCSACSVGYYSPAANQGFCLQCPAGSYSSVIGAGNCSQCLAGWYQGSSGQSFCSQCAAGSYVSSAGQVQCLACPIGTFMADQGATVCSNCPTGTISTLASSTSCVNCSSGQIAPVDGLSYCQPCPGGSYNPFSGQSECISCAQGYFQGTQGLSYCSACATGRYLDAQGQVDCIDCPVGYYSNSTGATACTACPPGTYAGSSKATVCASCDIGTYASSRGTVSCSPCDVGSYAPNQTMAACIVCPVGYVQPATGQSSCAACPAGSAIGSTGQGACQTCSLGTFTSVSGTSACYQCPAGTYSINAGPSQGPTACLNCTAGRYGNSPGQANCLDCAVGHYSNTSGVTICSDCLPGEYTDAAALTACKVCSSGQYSSGSSAITCVVCPVGTYGNGSGLSTCTSCLPGFYQSQSGQSFCFQCTAGTYSGASGQALCLPCNAGSYSPEDGSTTCTACGLGTYQLNPGQTSCLNCTSGAYSSALGQPSCLACPVGSYSPLPGSVLCTSCPAGFYASSAGNAQCLPCAIGTYASGEHTITCPSCNPGTYAGVTNLTSCVNCAPGYYQSSAGASACSPCARGYFIDAYGAASCSECPEGSYSPSNGSANCSQCLAGSYQNSSGQSGCTLCAPGYYTDTVGQAVCKPCSQGYISNTSGSSSCYACPAGTSQIYVGQSSCTPCIAGEYNPATAQSTCLRCSPGSYSNSTGFTTCTRCVVGYYQPQYAANSCMACAQGSIANVAGLDSCTFCLVGTYAASAGLSVCAECLVGYYQPSEASNSCVLCPPGEYTSSTAQSTCQRCAAGSSAQGYGSTNCTSCDAGSYQPQDGASSCVQCDQGMYTSSSGQNQCKFCSYGSYSNSTGSTGCTPCAVGFYQNIQGQNSCIACGAGYVSGAVGQAGCTSCPAGTYAPTSAMSSCIGCLPGYFQASQTSNSCHLCPPGYYTSGSSQSACDECAAGSFSSSYGSTNCTSCLPGYYQSQGGSSSCVLCSEGSYSASSGQTQCKFCSFGTISNTTGLSSCFSCPAGYFQAGQGRNVCEICAAGTYTSAAGQSSCSSCAAGSYSSSAGSTGCTSCIAGYYQSSSSASACSACDEGSYTASSGQSVCKFCAEGLFSNHTAATGCIDCLPGTVQPSIGMNYCTSCPPGFVAAASGQSACVQCSPGTYAENSSLTVCTSCTVGYFQPQYGATSCSACPYGQYSISDGLQQCKYCPAGTFANATGTSQCFDCPAGYFQSAIGAENCTLCPTGFVNPSAGQSSCVQCSPGSYAGQIGMTGCILCTAGSVSPQYGALSCTECGAGTYSSSSGQESCKYCGLGTYTNSSGQTVCTACSAGSFQNSEGATNCSLCAVGYATASTGQSACGICSAGSFANTTGLTGCMSCPIGYYQPGSGVSACIACAQGTYSASVGQSECVFCLEGTYAVNLGSSACSACLPGYFQGKLGANSCDACPEGEYSSAFGQSICGRCNPGQYANTSALSFCAQCESGTIQPQYGGSNCTNCSAGSYSPSSGQASCKFCLEGTYSSQPQSSTCTSCTAGYYQLQIGSTSCDPCSPGYYAPLPGASQCLQCAPGSFSQNYSSLNCSACTVGYYQSFYASNSCLPCAAGRYVDARGQEFCSQCAVGTFNNVSGSSTCTSCPAGSNQEFAGSTVCTFCLAGTYTPLPGQAACSYCPPGQYSSRNGSSSCIDCNPGSYNQAYGATSCELCPSGKFQPTSGQSECTLCTEGTVANQTGSQTCVSCGVGTYQAHQGMGYCDPCELGSYNQAQGQSQCFGCGYGTYSSVTGVTICQQCSSGQYQDSIGGTSCLACPAGEFSDASSQRYCTACPNGKFTATTGASQCSDCAIGTYQSDTGATMCSPCDYGTYTSTNGTSFCTPCPVGTYSSILGVSTCPLCEAGSYQNIPGSSTCITCPIGRSISVSGQAQCDFCGFGTYGNITGLTTCFSCPPGTDQPAEGQWRCNLCPAGQFSLSGQELCTPCGAGTVSSSEGTAYACTPCDSHSTPNYERTVCSCYAGYYMPEDATSGADCAVCPYGADCTNAGTTWENIGALPGYWRSSNTTLNFYRCILVKFCPGGVSDDAEVTSTPCASEHTGPLCGVCVEGYYSTSGGECSPCPSSNSSSWAYFFLVGAAAVFFVWLSLYIVLRSGRELLESVVAKEDLVHTEEVNDGSVSDDNFLLQKPASPDLLSHNSRSQSAKDSASENESGSDSGSEYSGSESESEYSDSESEHQHQEQEPSSVSHPHAHSPIAPKMSLPLSFEGVEPSNEELVSEQREVQSSKQLYDNNQTIDKAENLLALRSQGRPDDGAFYDCEIAAYDENKLTIYGPPVAAPNFTYKLKIALGFAQIVSCIATSLQIQWPATFQSFLLELQVFNINFSLVQGSGTACISGVNFYKRYLMVVLAPIIVFVLISFFYLLPRYLGLFCFSNLTATKILRSKITFWRMFLYILFLIYPGLSSTVLGLYVCIQIDSTSYIFSDLSQECYTSEWTEYSYGSMALVLLYPIGIPAFFFTLLYINRHHLLDNRVKAQLGFLYAGYRVHNWWFEIVDSIQKLFLTAILPFFPTDIQMPVGMVASGLYIMTILRVNPYIRSSDDRLALLAHNEILLLLLAGYIFYISPLDPYDTTSNLAFSAVLIAMACLFFLLFVLAGVVVGYKFFIKWRQERREAAGLLAASQAEQDRIQRIHQEHLNNKRRGGRADPRERLAVADSTHSKLVSPNRAPSLPPYDKNGPAIAEKNDTFLGAGAGIATSMSSSSPNAPAHIGTGITESANTLDGAGLGFSSVLPPSGSRPGRLPPLAPLSRPSSLAS